MSLVFYVVLGKGPIAIFGIQVSSCPRQLIEEMVRWNLIMIISRQ